MSSNRNKNLPVRKTMCGTCPFRPGSKYANLAPDLAASASTSTSRICHSTGSNNAIHKRTGLLPHICRGARDVQLTVVHLIGAITEPTDEAWNEARVKVGMAPQVITDPEVKHK